MFSFVKGAILALLLSAATAQAQLATQPLLNRVNPVPPNLTLVVDDSWSMRVRWIYEYGQPWHYGPRGPATGSLIPGELGGLAENPYGGHSPDINRLHYDPRVRYLPRPDYQGNPLARGPDLTEWNVYFPAVSGPYGVPVPPFGQIRHMNQENQFHVPAYQPPPELVVTGSTASYPGTMTAVLSARQQLPPQHSLYLPTQTYFPKFIGRSDCVSSATACTLAEERHNYTNWHTWYSTRAEATKTGIGLAFQPLKNESIRLGYGSLLDLAETTAGDNPQPKIARLHRGVSLYSAEPGGTKAQFFDWLYNIDPLHDTPSIQAMTNVGKYHERTDSDGPWGTTPNPASTGVGAMATVISTEPIGNHASCRRSFSLLFTDGYWNDIGGWSPAGGPMTRAITAWSIERPGRSAYQYTPAKPFIRQPGSQAQNTLADVAMHYWGRDLRPDLINRVPERSAAGKNESTWQNVSFYALTLGMLGTLPRTTTTWARLNDPNDSLYWPDPGYDPVTDSSKTKIDDTWHATVNGRGEMLNANNASELTRALKRMLEDMTGAPHSIAGVAVSNPAATAGMRRYKPEYIAGPWSGNLTASTLDPATGNEATLIWSVENGVDLNGDPQSTIPAAALRNIVTWNGSSSVPFAAAANTPFLNADLAAYLRGDAAKEQRKPGGIYRDRIARLGDIVNSVPLFVKGMLDMNYEALSGNGAPPSGSYRSFVAAKGTRAGTVFVGANDGMLHAFNDSTGAEKFAYVPQAVWSKLPLLAQTPYNHEYFVDGPNAEADAYLGGTWKNLVLGTTGAGAKAVYAVDATASAPTLRWEVNSGTTGFGHLGHVLSEVQAGLLRTGEWVAVFGNGFASAGGTARLYVVNLETGALIRDIAVGAVGANGLGAVTLARDEHRRIVGAYAGDLQGSLWKFDLSTGDGVGSRLYEPSAASLQPITAAPAVLPHPRGGHVVSFGTGKFFEEADKDPQPPPSTYPTQRLYGIWDASPIGAAAVSVPGVTQLVQQTVTVITVGPRKFSRISAHNVAWGNGSTGVRGWYLDLPHAGQRLVDPIQRLPGTFVLASTLSPKDDAGTDICLQNGGAAWSYIIDGVTGSGLTKVSLDTNGDGAINHHDTIASGFQHAIGGGWRVIGHSSSSRGSRVVLVGAGTGDGAYGSAGGRANTGHGGPAELSCGQAGAAPCPAGNSRQWRQIFLR